MVLRREDVVGAALALCDRYGLGDLSMRRVADRLGVQPGALYWHVRDKQTLLALVGDAVLADVALPADDAWRPWLTAWADALRRTLLAHRDSAELVAAARASGLSTAPVFEAARERLVAAGLPEADAAVAVHALTHFCLGALAEEQTRATMSELGLGGEGADPDAYAAGVALWLDGVAARLSRRGFRLPAR